MDPKLAALLARRKQKQEDEGDAGYYIQDDDIEPKSREKHIDHAPPQDTPPTCPRNEGSPGANGTDSREDVRKRRREEARKLREESLASNAIQSRTNASRDEAKKKHLRSSTPNETAEKTECHDQLTELDPSIDAQGLNDSDGEKVELPVLSTDEVELKCSLPDARQTSAEVQTSANVVSEVDVEISCRTPWNKSSTDLLSTYVQPDLDPEPEGEAESTIEGLQETGEKVSAAVASFGKMQQGSDDGVNMTGSASLMMNDEDEAKTGDKTSPRAVDTIDELMNALISMPIRPPTSSARSPEVSTHDGKNDDGSIECSVQPKISASLPSSEASKSPQIILNTSKPSYVLPKMDSGPIRPQEQRIQGTSVRKHSLEQKGSTRWKNLPRVGSSSNSLGTLDEDDGERSESPVLRADKRQEQEILKRREQGKYELLVAIPKERNNDLPSDAVKDKWLSEKLDLALRSRGYTWSCITAKLLQDVLHETVRTKSAGAACCFIFWSILSHLSITVGLRGLILSLHDCERVFPLNESILINTSSCNVTVHGIRAMTNHSFFHIAQNFAVTWPPQDYSVGTHVLHEGQTNGMMWAFLLFLMLVLQAGALQASVYLSAGAAADARAQLMSLIYGKALVSAEFCDTEMRDGSDGQSSSQLHRLLLDDVDALVKREQYSHVFYILPIHCLASVFLIMRDMGPEPASIALFALLCTACIVFTLSYTLNVTSSRSKHPASTLRVQRVFELLQHYVQIALLGWQDLFITAIDEVREIERERLEAQAIIKSVTYTWAMVTGLLALACLLLGGAIFDKCGGPTENVCSTPGLIIAACHTSVLTCAMAVMTLIFPKLCERKPSVDRVVEFLLTQDRSTSHANCKENTLLGSVVMDNATAVRMVSATFVWRPKVDKRTFRIGLRGSELNVTIRKREVVGVISPKCEGKSSFLLAIAGVMPRERGQLHVAGKSYLCQAEPLLIDGTIQDNVLFGLPYDEDMYKRAIYCSCLEEKLENLRLKDLTRVGRDKGMIGFNPISGSQALDPSNLAALALARALYANADLYLFDNLFEALGSDGVKAWERCIERQLPGATVVVACNSSVRSAYILRTCDRIIVLGARRFKDPLPSGCLVANIFDNGSLRELNHRDIDVVGLDKVDSIADSWEILMSGLWSYKPDSCTVRLSAQSTLSSASSPSLSSNHASFIKTFAAHTSWGWTAVSMIVSLLPVACRFLMGYLVLIISSRGLIPSDEDDGNEVLVAYAGCIVFICMLLCLVCTILWLRSAFLKMVEQIHDSLLQGLRAARKLPLISHYQWAGLGSDALVWNVLCLDEAVPEDAIFYIQHFGCIFAELLLIYYYVAIIPIQELLVAPALFQLLFVAVVYAGSVCAQAHAHSHSDSRQLIRDFCQSTASGLFLIHTTGCFKQFRLSMDALVGTYLLDQVLLSRTLACMALALDWAAALLVLSLSLAVITHRDLLAKDGSVVLAVHIVAAGVQICTYIQFAAYGSSQSKAIYELCLAPAQAWQRMLGDVTASDDAERTADIPMGPLKIKAVTVMQEGVAVLKNVDLRVNTREYLVVLGDADAGKSTLAMSILRAIYPVSGAIEVSNIDINTMSLAALRKYVGLVPSRPILFKGSLMANLDPGGNLHQSEILPLLIAVGLVEGNVRTMPQSMKTVIEDVDRVSSTVKQLICLCRVLLRKPQLLILDEFGAYIDGRRVRQIDRFLAMQDQFAVLQLSRNFQHVQHCTRVVVLRDGQVAEEGKPAALLANAESILRSNVLALGPAFLNKFRCDIDLWEAEVAEKKSLRSSMLEQLEAEWDARDIQLLSPSSFLRGNGITAEVHALSPGASRDGLSDPGSLPESARDSLQGTRNGLHGCDVALQMSIAQSCISWLHASLCEDHEASKSHADWTDRVFVTSLLPHQALQVEDALKACSQSGCCDETLGLSSDPLVVADILVHALSAICSQRRLLSADLAQLISDAHAQGPAQMEIIVLRILEDDDSSLELFVQLLWLLWSLTTKAQRQERKFRTETLAGRFAGLLVRQGDGEASKPLVRHAILALLEHGHLLFKEHRLWTTQNDPGVPSRDETVNRSD